MHRLLQLAALFLVLAGVKPQTCPTFGDDSSHALNQWSIRTQLFMDFHSPAQCNGTVVEWNYCFYGDRSRGSAGDVYGVKFMVYRSSNVTGVYNIVNNSLNYLKMDYELLPTHGSGCSNTILNTTQQFQILQNDIVAACIIEGDSEISRLRVANQNPNQAYYVRVGCTDHQLKSIDLNSEYEIRDLLRLNASIMNIIPCRVGDNPKGSSEMTAQGTFLNTRSPAQCNGTVTSWHYCYYPSGADEDDVTYTAFVALWRRGDALEQYNIVEGSVSEIEIQGEEMLHDIYCRKHFLHSENHVEIRTGDVAGVLLPDDNPIPMVGSSSITYQIERSRDDTNQMSPGNITDTSDVQLTLHLYADISETGSSELTDSTESTELTDSTKSAELTDSTTQSDSAGLSGGGIAGIVIFMIILLVLGGVTVVLVLIIVWRKKVFKKSESSTYPVDRTTAGVGFDNLNYTGIVAAPYENAVTGTYIPPRAPLSHAQQGSLSCTYESMRFQSGSYIYPDPPPSDLHSSNIYASVNVVNQHTDLMEQNREQDIYAGLSPYQAPAGQEEQLYSQIEAHSYVATDIGREDVFTVKHLGEGQFGSVDEGVWETPTGNVAMAMKVLKDGSSESDKVKFLQEAVTMAQFRHPNVVILYGMVTQGEPIILVVELIEKGDLRKNLHEMRPNPREELGPDVPLMLLKFSQHIALGMQYLSGKGFIHRDLAARNILLSKDNVCKIADFGMSRDLEDDTYYTSSGGLVPVKWTAPEAIKFKKYTTASDVWSYGCVLYEIWSLGHKPFENYPNMKIIGILDTGKRLSPPSGCPREVYQLMIRCWHPDKSLRPGFRDASLTLTEEPTKVLHIPQSVLDTNPQFENIGHPLSVGEEVYSDLQTSYQNT